MSRAGALLRALLLIGAALTAAGGSARAEPYEVDPDLATRDEDYAAGKRAVDRQDWGEAIRRFKLAERRHPEQADLQNILGYAHRNLKQYDLAFVHYKRAIELEPRHRGAHEYIGEAYLMRGDLARAEAHLRELDRLCGTRCEEREDLHAAIEQYKARATTTR